jgi:hypothetical protein
VSFPRTATAVTPDPVIALKAYSDYQLTTFEFRQLTYRLDTAIGGVSLSSQKIEKNSLPFLLVRRLLDIYLLVCPRKGERTYRSYDERDIVIVVRLGS